MIFRPYHYFDTGCAAEAFVDALADVPPKPADMERVLRFNLGQADERPREHRHRA
jgi:hypothetical protein